MRSRLLSMTLVVTALAVLIVAPVLAQGKGPGSGVREGESPLIPLQPNGTAGAICTTGQFAIPDSDPNGVDIMIDASGTAGTITDLDFSINTVHTWVGDLIFTVSYNATSATVMDRPGVPASAFGCSGDDILATIDDEAATAVEDECGAGTPTINGTFIGGDPANTSLLAAYDGMSADGVWTVNVSDNAGGDTGTVQEVCIVPTLATGVPTLTETATLVLAVLLAAVALLTLYRARATQA